MNREPQVDLQDIQRRYCGRIKTGIDPEGYEENVKAMMRLLDEWDPVGHGARDVRLILGTPSSTDDDGTLRYFFDSGYGGVTWIFHVKDGRVTKVEHETHS